MNLFLLRHTRVNRMEGVCYGQSKVDLADTFEYELSDIMLSLKRKKFKNIYSSPLLRCKILAEAIVKDHSEITFDERLMELNFGKWEGLKWQEIEKTKEAKRWFEDYLNVACPEGESYQDLLNRCKSFISSLKEIQSNSNLLVVTHAGPIRAIYSIINGISPKEAFNLQIDYGQIIKLKI